ncbi:MAG: RecQ family ATP-dependent DNA helicase [Aphanocapsa sp. GSE-SYN-MK-11-07L]|jgi:ATP-dependent DNA helicase RecQ|nr:RecQ family ATP-dependent DNA helicase [Aphanocapsa sp. GSE-SYN-MK-11-07L]
MDAEATETPNSPDPLETAQAEFQRYWGYTDFRPPQAEVIRSLLTRQDALIVLPTGAGKSLCFQLPAILQQGLTLVISPLIALMEDQVTDLRQRQLPAASLHGQLSRFEKQRLLGAIERQQLRLLYLSPETLLSRAVWEQLCLPQVQINGLVVDEAHCLVEWGSTFRPSYRRLGTVRSALLGYKPAGAQIAIAAFTATADPATQGTIQTVLGLQQPKLFRYSPYRANLALQIQTVWSAAQRRWQVLRLIEAQSGSGLVYARTRQDCQQLATWLTEQGHPTVAYHGGLSAAERRQLESQWLAGQQRFVVCTSAFGLGINKPNCRWICHFQAPLSLTEYIQEIGRAGRDGQPAIAVTLVSEPTGWLEPSDRDQRRFFAQQLKSQQQAAQKLIPQLPQQGDARSLNQPESAIALALLHQAGQLTWQDPFHYVIHSGWNQQAIVGAKKPEQMLPYLKTTGCRWGFLLRAFGFGTESRNLRCQHCDNCRNRP